jgi:hypothetical protein
VILMRFDVRLPLGLLFLTIGTVLLVYALFGRLDAPAAQINTRCGLAMIVFGAGCLALARTTRRDDY